MTKNVVQVPEEFWPFLLCFIIQGSEYSCKSLPLWQSRGGSGRPAMEKGVEGSRGDGATWRRPAGWHCQFLSSALLWLSRHSPIMTPSYFTQSCQFSALLHQQSIPRRRRRKRRSRRRRRSANSLIKLPLWGMFVLLLCNFRNCYFFFRDGLWLELNFLAARPLNSGLSMLSGVNGLQEKL